MNSSTDPLSFSFAQLFKPGLHSLEGLAILLNSEQTPLLDLLYRNKTSNYSHFSIRKKNGHSRSIHAPKKELRALQRTLASHLQNFHTPKLSSHGFLPDRSVKTNALPHTGKNYVFNIDLKDFFESIHFGRIKNLFMSKPFNAPHNVATVIAHMCCHNGRLAQGAPTSPIISNMIALKLDAQLQKLAADKKCHYTRYADDITFSFSCSLKRIPSEIVQIAGSEQASPGETLKDIIEKNGFTINSEKTRLKHKTQRQIVTGLTVNKFPNLSRDYIRRTSSMIHALRKFGSALAEQSYIDIMKLHAVPLAARQKNRINKKEGDFFIKVIKGRLNYIQMIRGRNDPVYRKLAYFFSVAIGKENTSYLKSAEEILGESIFVVHNDLDDGQGTAFLLGGIGIVTNHHVIDGIDNETAPHCITFTTTENPARELTAELIFSNKSMDLAIFHPGHDFDNVPPLKLTTSKRLKFLDPVLALGFPNYTKGSAPYINSGKIVQSRSVYNSTFWLVDLPLLKGNSGGPILNSRMEVVGVATIGSKNHDRTTILHGFLPFNDILKIAKNPDYLYRKKVLDCKKTGTKNLVNRIDISTPLKFTPHAKHYSLTATPNKPQ